MPVNTTVVPLRSTQVALPPHAHGGDTDHRQRRFIERPDLGVNDAAISYAGGVATRSGSTIFARHRNAQNRTLGWEAISPPQEAGGRIMYRYTAGATRGFFWTPLRSCTRLVVASGPLQALQLATQEGPQQDTCYAAAGGVWTVNAHEVLDQLLHRGAVTEIALSLTPDHNGQAAIDRIRAIAAYHPHVCSVVPLLLPLSAGGRAV